MDSLNVQAAKAQFSEAIGATYGTDETCDLWEKTISELQAAVISAVTATADATHAAPPKGVSAETLSKVFRLNTETAKKTVELNTQLNRCIATSSLSRNFSTNDRMLQYRHINSIFFTGGTN